jgi:hypothetical protein
MGGDVAGSIDQLCNVTKESLLELVWLVGQQGMVVDVKALPE